jgi:hypothetical protein
MFIGIGVVAVTVFGLVTMLLWNWLVPVIFNGPVLTFWQALGLLLLSKILFWGFGGKHHSRHGGSWKHRYYQKFANMSPEEREAFKRRMKDKWCNWEKDEPSKVESGGSNV